MNISKDIKKLFEWVGNGKIENLGKWGGFAHSGMYRINDKWIMKITDVKEYRITEEMQGHPNIVSMLPMSRRSGKYASVVMEYCEGGNLTNYNIKDKQSVIEDITKGIGHMLSKGYVNNDLWRDTGQHLGNFFVRGNGTVVLGDFGDVDRVNSKNLTKLSEHINKIIQYINIY